MVYALAWGASPSRVGSSSLLDRTILQFCFRQQTDWRDNALYIKASSLSEFGSGIQNSLILVFPIGSGPVNSLAFPNFFWFILVFAEMPLSDLFWLSEAQMAMISPYFPLAHGVPRVDRSIARQILCQWKGGWIWRVFTAYFVHFLVKNDLFL